MAERTFAAGGAPTGESVLEFRWPAGEGFLS
jgi:hypothetical protein